MSIKINDYIKKYIKKYYYLLNFDKSIVKNINLLVEEILKIKKNNKKVVIFGNGGSAAIASHFSVDLTKNSNVRCQNFNESDLITCFANDFGFDNWVSNALKYYIDQDDLIILISSSGKSFNMINAAKKFKSKYKIITFTGFEKNNLLKKNGHINFWVNSKSYNHIENIHQIILLLIVDIIIEKNKKKLL